MFALDKIQECYDSTINMGHYSYKLYEYKRNQFLDRSQLIKIQVEKLKVLLHHSYYKVNYYRRLFDRAGIKPKDFQTIQDLAKIPITARKELQSLPKEEVISRGAWWPLRLFNFRTSGSTGMPLDVIASAGEIKLRSLLYRRMYFENGGKLTDKELLILTPETYKRWVWYHHLGILKRKRISIFDDIESQLKTIVEFKPEIIRSYSSTLKNLAIDIKKKKIKGINPRIIFTTAELLTEQDRKFITSVFQAEIFDYYSSNECGVIAWECKQHTGYHLNNDDMIIEFIKEDGTQAKDGEEGEIVITSLNSYTMPFIRYKLGDVGIPYSEKCPCGRTLPLMKVIAGRANDAIILANGRKISPYRLTTAIESLAEVDYYQIIQERKDMIKVNIVKNKKLSFVTKIKIKENFNNILGNNIEILINEVDELIKEGSGKFKVFKSELNNV